MCGFDEMGMFNLMASAFKVYARANSAAPNTGLHLQKHGLGSTAVDTAKAPPLGV